MRQCWVLRLVWLLAATAHVARAIADCGDRVDRLGWYTPDYLVLKTGGHQGFMAFGAGYELFDSRLQLGAQYGWVPPALGGKTLHSLAFIVSGRARGWCVYPGVNWSYLYGGIGLLFPVGGDGFFFLRVPERYGDRGYYRKNGLRLIATLGTELQIQQRNSRLTLTHAAFWEVVALDEYVFIWSQNRGQLSFAYPWSSALGYRLRF